MRIEIDVSGNPEEVGEEPGDPGELWRLLENYR